MLATNKACKPRVFSQLRAIGPCKVQTVTIVPNVWASLFSLRGGHPDLANGGPARSRSIRARIAANSSRGTATSAIWNTTYRMWWTTFAPIVIGFARSVVSERRDQPLVRSSTNGSMSKASISPSALQSAVRLVHSTGHLAVGQLECVASSASSPDRRYARFCGFLLAVR